MILVVHVHWDGRMDFKIQSIVCILQVNVIASQHLNRQVIPLQLQLLNQLYPQVTRYQSISIQQFDVEFEPLKLMLYSRFGIYPF